jgi:hypothetical protein
MCLLELLIAKLLLRVSVTENVCQAEAKEESIPNNFDAFLRKVTDTAVPSSPLQKKL